MTNKLLIALLAIATLTACASEKAEPVSEQTPATETIEKADAPAEKAVASESTPMPATVVDANMGMGETMRMMAQNYMAVSKADSLEAMAEPAQLLADYTSQAEVLAANNGKENSADMVKEMQVLGELIAQLQAHIAAGDEAAAKAIIEAMAEQKSKAHSMFK